MSISSDLDEQMGLKEIRSQRYKFRHAAKPLAAGQAYMTAESAAEKLGTSRQDVLTAIKTNLLEACRGKHNRYMIHPDDLERYRVMTNQKGKAT